MLYENCAGAEVDKLEAAKWCRLAAEQGNVAAAHFDLHFKAMVEERFYIVINREFHNTVREIVTEFCARLEFVDADRMNSDEFVPTVAVMKRVHGVGSWRQV